MEPAGTQGIINADGENQQNPVGESQKQGLRVSFDGRLKLEFHAFCRNLRVSSRVVTDSASEISEGFELRLNRHESAHFSHPGDIKEPRSVKPFTNVGIWGWKRMRKILVDETQSRWAK